MLKQMSTDVKHRDHIKNDFNPLDTSIKKRFKPSSIKKALHKMTRLKLDPAREVIFSRYSWTGRPVLDPAVSLKSFILMNHMGCTSILEWVDKAQNDALCKFLIGTDKVPSASSHYDFINRILGVDTHCNELEPKGRNLKKNKEARKVKLKAEQKWENCTINDVKELVDAYADGASQDRERIGYTMQCVFNAIIVIPSIKRGLLDPLGIISGDGSCVHIHATARGHRVVDSKDPNESTTRYTRAGADIGWDSIIAVWYFGFTMYNLSQYNPNYEINLPFSLPL